jgi:hypothetical protein
MFAWHPYYRYTCHQNLLNPIGLFWPNAPHTITPIIITGQQQSTTMIVHKHGSHKKWNITWLNSMDEKRAVKKVHDSEPCDDVSTILVVTQSQDTLVLLNKANTVPVTSMQRSSIAQTLVSPYADNVAVVDKSKPTIFHSHYVQTLQFY